jgi:hypothetical protein
MENTAGFNVAHTNAPPFHTGIARDPPLVAEQFGNANCARKLAGATIQTRTIKPIQNSFFAFIFATALDLPLLFRHIVTR